MPRNPKYPLEALREHRDRGVDAATVQLADAVRGREAADEAKRAASDERSDAEGCAAAIRNDEAAYLARGDLRVADLARNQAWEVAMGARIADLGHAVARAEGEVVAAQDAEGRARDELARKKADLDVIAKDKARFADRVRRAGEAAEEEGAEEAFAGRRRDG